MNEMELVKRITFIERMPTKLLVVKKIYRTEVFR